MTSIPFLGKGQPLSDLRPRPTLASITTYPSAPPTRSTLTISRPQPLHHPRPLTVPNVQPVRRPQCVEHKSPLAPRRAFPLCARSPRLGRGPERAGAEVDEAIPLAVVQPVLWLRGTVKHAGAV